MVGGGLFSCDWHEAVALQTPVVSPLKRRIASSGSSRRLPSAAAASSPGRTDTKASCVTNWGLYCCGGQIRINGCVCVVMFIKTFLRGLGQQRVGGGIYIIKCMLFTWNVPLKAGSLRSLLRHIVKDRRSEKSATAALQVKSASGWSRLTPYRRASPSSMCSLWDLVCWWRVSVFILCWNWAKCCESTRCCTRCVALTSGGTWRYPGHRQYGREFCGRKDPHISPQTRKLRLRANKKKISAVFKKRMLRLL